MDNQRMLKFCEQLDGISAMEWKKLKLIVDQLFSQKTRELERELKLSAEDAEETIRQQFG